ncbi:hypothetical protein Celaphus_00005146, partial [Cervus elaphus hippelaphus]
PPAAAGPRLQCDRVPRRDCRPVLPGPERGSLQPDLGPGLASPVGLDGQSHPAGRPIPGGQEHHPQRRRAVPVHGQQLQWSLEGIRLAPGARGPAGQHPHEVTALLPGHGGEGPLLGLRIPCTPHLLEPRGSRPAGGQQSPRGCPRNPDHSGGGP